MFPITDRDIRRTTTPYVVYALVAINVLIAFYTLFVLSNVDETIAIYRFGAIPSELSGGPQLGIVRLITDSGAAQRVDLTSPVPTWATIFTAMFLHGSLLHIGGNMLFLWVFGDNVEDRLGHISFLVFYLACGFVAAWTQVAIDPSSQAPMIGASGAIAGVLGAYIVLYPRSRVDTLVFFGLIFPVRIPAYLLLGGWILLQVFTGFGSVALNNGGGGVAYFAHIGGFAVGAVAIIFLRSLRLLRRAG